MYEWALKITALQDLDIRVSKIQEQLQEIPEKMQKSELLYKTETNAYNEAKKQLNATEIECRSMETAVAQLQERKRNFQAKTTMIRNNDEYRSAIQQIEQCDKDIAAQEEKQLDAMFRLDKQKEEVAARKKAMEHARKRSEDVINDLKDFQAQCEAQIARLTAERPALEADVQSPEILSIYKRLRSGTKNSKTQPCVVPMVSGACGHCRMMMTEQDKHNVVNGKVVICPTCGALVYLED